MKKVPSHYLKATGESSKLVINKSPGPVDVNNTPKSNGTIRLDPYRGKK
jgi:hypothetical protein